MANKITRTYSNEQTLGDILYNPETKSVWMSIELGLVGKLNIGLELQEDKTYTLTKKFGSKISNIGRTFQVTDKENNVIEGITQGNIALGNRYDSTLKKNVLVNDNAIFFKTFKLKKAQVISDKLVKVGFVKGCFGINTTPQQQEAA
ncbi:hypothetical protein HOK00_00625 [bacterium]|jgi:hypothetical protein|nr:hypothetical protein [bacterium]